MGPLRDVHEPPRLVSDEAAKSRTLARHGFGFKRDGGACARGNCCAAAQGGFLLR